MNNGKPPNDEKPVTDNPWIEPETGMRFNAIPGGTFLMGSPDNEPGRNPQDEGPVHAVTLDGFWMGRHPVTQAQWQILMGNNTSQFKTGPDYPVTNVSWDEAQVYIQKLNGRHPDAIFRLPTEAEWEYACRAGTTTPFHSGSTLCADTQANYNGMEPFSNGPPGKFRCQTTPVDRFPANAFGLLDMHGNVWEWCADAYQADYYAHAPKHNPLCATLGNRGRVMRGGSWNYGAFAARSAYRNAGPPHFRVGMVGFRLAGRIPT